MEKSNTKEPESHILWMNQSEYILSFHPVEEGDFQPLTFSDQREKMEFVFQKCSSGFRIQ